MAISSRTPEGLPNRCPICGAEVRVEPSNPAGDAPCPHCGHLLWFANRRRAPGTPTPTFQTFHKNLAERLAVCKQQGLPGIPRGELLDYMTSAARAIDYLNEPTHTLGAGAPVAIRHLDIKPANLLIVGDGLQVCDYGPARAPHAPGTVAGTPAYMAPELFALKPSRGTDQYSLAITYYELRTGRLPFDVSQVSLFELMRIHTEGKLDLSLLPPAELEVLRKATLLKPDQRYPTCLEFVRELERASG